MLRFESSIGLSRSIVADTGGRAMAAGRVGDDDLIELSHTCAMYEALPAAQLSVVPGASHFVPIEKPAEVSHLICDFLGSDASPQTMMPCRRSRPTGISTS